MATGCAATKPATVVATDQAVEGEAAIVSKAPTTTNGATMRSVTALTRRGTPSVAATAATAAATGWCNKKSSTVSAVGRVANVSVGGWCSVWTASEDDEVKKRVETRSDSADADALSGGRAAGGRVPRRRATAVLHCWCVAGGGRARRRKAGGRMGQGQGSRQDGCGSKQLVKTLFLFCTPRAAGSLTGGLHHPCVVVHPPGPNDGPQW